MAFTLKQGTKCYLVDGDTKYELLVSEASASQTTQEASHSIKTIHNRNVVDRSFANSKTPVSFSFTFFAEKGFEEVGESVLKWFGFTSNGLRLDIPVTAQALSRDFYVQASNKTYKIENCYAENLTVSFGPKQLMMFEVTAVGSDLTVENIPNTVTTTYLQDSANFFNSLLSSIEVSGSNIDHIVSTTFQVTRGLSWITDKTIQDSLSGNIHTPTNIINTQLSISGTITQNLTTDTLNPVSYGNLIITSDDCLINLDSVKYTQRRNLDSDIHQLVTDYKLLPSSMNNYIQI